MVAQVVGVAQTRLIIGNHREASLCGRLCSTHRGPRPHFFLFHVVDVLPQLIEIGAGYADDTATVFEPDGMDFPHIKQSNIAGIHAEFPRNFNFRMSLGVTVIEPMKRGHIGVADRLPVDCPGRPVIVRRSTAGASMVVDLDAKVGIGVLKDNRPAGRGIGTEMLGDKVFILKQTFKETH